MSRRSGIRSIMDDIASIGLDADDTCFNLSPGNPAHIPEVVAAWQGLTRIALEEQFVEFSTRYGPSRGTPALVGAIVDYFGDTLGWPIRPEHVVVGPGSQMLAFILTALYAEADPGRECRLVLPRLPDYTGYQGLPLMPGRLAGVAPLVVTEGERHFRYAVDVDAVAARDDVGLMLVSNPANPSGSTLDAAELHELAEIAGRREAPLVVDNAYGRPFPGIVPTHAAPVWHPDVVNLFTFSKAGLPGERVAFAIGAAELIDPVVSFIANCALHGPQLVQAVAARALTSRLVDDLVADHIRPHYRAKLRRAQELLAGSMPDGVDWRLHSGDGGLFCWLHIDHDWFDDLELYELLKRRSTFVVPGRHFFVPPLDSPFLSTHGRRCVRLSLSNDDWTIAEGINRMGHALDELRAAAAAPA